MAIEPIEQFAFNPASGWNDSTRFPTYEDNEEQVRADLQALHNQTRDYINSLRDYLEDYADDVAAGAVAGTIPDGTITTSKLQDNAVSTAKIQPGAVKAGNLDTGAVATAKIAGEAVTGEKIASKAVTANKLDDDAVMDAKVNSTVADALGLDVDTDDVADALIKLSTQSKIGNVMSTAADLGNKWLKCDGSLISADDYEELVTLLAKRNGPYVADRKEEDLSMYNNASSSFSGGGLSVLWYYSGYQTFRIFVWNEETKTGSTYSMSGYFGNTVGDSYSLLGWMKLGSYYYASLYYKDYDQNPYYYVYRSDDLSAGGWTLVSNSGAGNDIYCAALGNNLFNFYNNHYYYADSEDTWPISYMAVANTPFFASVKTALGWTDHVYLEAIQPLGVFSGGYAMLVNAYNNASSPVVRTFGVAYCATYDLTATWTFVPIMGMADAISASIVPNTLGVPMVITNTNVLVTLSPSDFSVVSTRSIANAQNSSLVVDHSSSLFYKAVVTDEGIFSYTGSGLSFFPTGDRYSKTKYEYPGALWNYTLFPLDYKQDFGFRMYIQGSSGYETTVRSIMVREFQPDKAVLPNISVDAVDTYICAKL